MLPLGLAEGLVGAGFGCARCRLGVPVGMSLGGSVRRFTLVGLVTCGCVTGFPVPVRPLSCRRPSSAVHLAIGNSLLDIGYSPLPSPVACLLTTFYNSPLSRSVVSPELCSHRPGIYSRQGNTNAYILYQLSQYSHQHSPGP